MRGHASTPSPLGKSSLLPHRLATIQNTMKFGCDFQNLQVTQWADAYLNYDGLKQLVKQDSSTHDLDCKMLAALGSLAY
jgi:hypothetical protein